MRLSDGDIEKRLAEQSIIIDPAPAANSIAGISVDLRLDHRFRVFNNNSVTHLDLSGDRSELEQSINRVMSQEIAIEEGDSFFIHPGELVLGATFESVKIPDDLVGWLEGRSSLARLGLMVHVTAGRIDPGWEGQIVLEFTTTENCHWHYALECLSAPSRLKCYQAQHCVRTTNAPTQNTKDNKAPLALELPKTKK